MIYLIFGTNFEARKLAKNKIINLLKKKGIFFDKMLETEKLNTDNYFLIEKYIKSRSLFGERYIINLKDLLSKESSREFIYKNLEPMKNSENIFLMDEVELLDASIQKIKRITQDFGDEFLIFNAKEKTELKKMNPFFLCELIEKRNRKEAWKEWLKIYQEYGESEDVSLHGALWWKWKNMWSAYLDEKKNYFKYRLVDKEIKYKKEELESFGEEIVFMGTWKADGENSLMRKIERFILKI